VTNLRANANRLKILKAIIASPNGELNVSSLCAELKLMPPKVSDHLKLLRINKIVSAKQIGIMINYSIKDPIVYMLLEEQR